MSPDEAARPGTSADERTAADPATDPAGPALGADEPASAQAATGAELPAEAVPDAPTGPPAGQRFTDKGLPKRTPQQVAAQPDPGQPRQQSANAEALRRRLGGFQQGAQHGRRDAAAENRTLRRPEAVRPISGGAVRRRHRRGGTHLNAPTARTTGSSEARNLHWLLNNLVEEVPGILSVAVVSSDGLLLLSSDPDRDEPAAAADDSAANAADTADAASTAARPKRTEATTRTPGVAAAATPRICPLAATRAVAGPGVPAPTWPPSSPASAASPSAPPS